MRIGLPLIVVGRLASRRRAGQVRRRQRTMHAAILTAPRPCYHRASSMTGRSRAGARRSEACSRDWCEALGRIERIDRRGCGASPHDRLGWPAGGRSPRAGRERRGQRLLPDGRGRRRRAVRGPGRARRPWLRTNLGDRRRGRPREPRAGPEGRRPPRGPFRPGARRHHRDPPRTPARGRVGVPRLRDRPGVDPAPGPQGLDRRRRRQPDAGRRRARGRSPSC